MYTIKKTKEVKIKVLESLGWDFLDIHESVAAAQGITIEQAKEYNYNNYYILIEVRENGSTFYRLKNYFTSTSDDAEPTGDDEQTIKDLAEIKVQNL